MAAVAATELPPAFTPGLAAAATAATAPPHLAFFLLDDWGWMDAGFRADTDLADATPFIDRLATEGVKLAHAYVSPVCSPTRAQYLTGRYALRLGFPTVVNPNRRGTLDTSLPTVAEGLRRFGYSSAMVGKW
eukprot:COSAG01_NODE_3664_length_5814_cov_15.571829_2_plen_132_part_00